MSLLEEMMLRDEGRARVELSNDEWIALARREAARICARHGRVSVNELHDWAEATGQHPESELAYSAVLKGAQWVDTGMRVQARHKGSHAREVRYWRYESTVYKGGTR